MIIASLQALITGIGEMQIGLWGVGASGKTHLLNASAEYARSRGRRLQIYDAIQLLHCETAEFAGGSDFDVLVVDNLDAIVGDSQWEACFYQIINRCQAGEFRFVFALTDKPEGMPFVLEDLRSRLQWGLLLQLPARDDNEVGEILRLRAQLIGIELSAEVISYLLTHYERNLAVQIKMLQQLDAASLSAQRRVTIPLVKQALHGWAD